MALKLIIWNSNNMPLYTKALSIRHKIQKYILKTTTTINEELNKQRFIRCSVADTAGVGEVAERNTTESFGSGIWFHE